MRAQRTISLPTTSLLMEGARQLDMCKRDGPARPAAAAPTVTAPVAVDDPADAGSPRALPMPVEPTPDFVADVAAILEDPFALGELRFLDRGQLMEWTSGPDVGKRCFGLLIAPVLSGVSVLAGMAAPLGEEHIASALQWDQRVLLWTVRGTSGAALDIVLLDCRLAAAMLDDVRCQASFAIYAPPRGDHMALPAHSATEVVTVLQHTRPTALLAMGNATIGACIEQLCEVAEISPQRVVVHRPIDDVSTDFRQDLLNVLTAWGNPEVAIR